jgi:hypothetical protein
LYELCMANNLQNIVMLQTHLTGDDLQALSKCKNFDVAIALNVFHHIQDWPSAVDAVFNLGDNIIIESPGAGDENARNPQMHNELYNLLSGKEHNLIHESESHVSNAKRYMMLFNSSSNTITQQTIDPKERGAPELGNVTITSNLNEKHIEINHMGASPITETRPFIPGMNLWNWKLLNGSWPINVRNRIISANAVLPDWHDDLVPWNFILNGDRCTAIDIKTKSWKTEPDDNALQKCLEMMSL